MSKVAMVVRYTPQASEFPMAKGQPIAAMIVGWDEDAETADLMLFTRNADYVSSLEKIKEGTEPGTFQQPASDGSFVDVQSAKSAPAVADAKAGAAAAKK